MKRILFAALFILSSCSGLVADETPEDNPNEIFYGTEWSTASQNEGLKFFKDNSVLFFSNNAHVTKTGSFQYSPENNWITLEGLTITTITPASEFHDAELTSSTTMDVYWHEIGKTKGYVTELYKRR